MSPSLHCIHFISLHLSQGVSVRSAIEAYINEFPTPFAIFLQRQMHHVVHGLPESLASALPKPDSEAQEALLECLKNGLEGHPIEESLRDLSLEVEEMAHQEVAEYLGLLPFKALVPLFLFQLPAFALLLFGPPLIQLFHGELNG